MKLIFQSLVGFFRSWQPHEPRVRIHIQDNNAGIPPENLTRLFEPFFTAKNNGTGLGLAICQRIAREHGGRITAQSEVRKGATFSISLPAIPAQSTPSRQGQPVKGCFSHRKKPARTLPAKGDCYFG